MGRVRDKYRPLLIKTDRSGNYTVVRKFNNQACNFFFFLPDLANIEMTLLKAFKRRCNYNNCWFSGEETNLKLYTTEKNKIVLCCNVYKEKHLNKNFQNH